MPSEVVMNSIDEIQDALMIVMEKLTGWEPLPKLDDDIFALGLDSLHVTRMVRALKQLFKRAGASEVQEGVTSQLVYNSPTISTLSRSLYGLTNDGSGGISSSKDAPREEQIEKFIDEFCEVRYRPEMQS